MRPVVAHLKPLVVDCALRAMASEGDQGWELPVFDGDPCSLKDIRSYWRYMVADNRFYSFMREDVILNGPGETGPATIRVFVGARWEKREGYASERSVGPHFAGEFPLADLVRPKEIEYGGLFAMADTRRPTEKETDAREAGAGGMPGTDPLGEPQTAPPIAGRDTGATVQKPDASLTSVVSNTTEPAGQSDE